MNNEIDLKVKVIEVEVMTEDISRYRFASVTGEQLPNFTAGAHIEVRINDEFTRSYSLCSDPNEAVHYYDIAVKKESDGRGGSKAFHNVAKCNSIFSISQPKNYFPLSDVADNHILIAGGIGLTPMIAMAYALHKQNKAFTFIASAHGQSQLPFVKELTGSLWPTHLFLSGRANFDLSSFISNVSEKTHIYCCGPEGFIENVKKQCNVLLDEQWHEEFFTATNLNSDSEGFELYLSKTDKHISVPAGVSMIQALHKENIEVDTVCEQGICGSCLVEWSDGDPIHRDQCLEESEREEYIALCCGGCNSKSLTLEL